MEEPSHSQTGVNDDDNDLNNWPDGGDLHNVECQDNRNSINYTFFSRNLDAVADVQHLTLTETNVQKAFRNLQCLVCDERLLLAHTLWHKLISFLGVTEAGVAAPETGLSECSKGVFPSPSRISPPTPNTDSVRQAMAHPQTRARLESLDRRVNACVEALDLFASETGWVFAQKYFGVSTHYRMEEDGTLTVRLRADLEECSVFDELAVLREADLYPLWAPFVRASSLVQEVGKCELVIWFQFLVPWLASRDACVHIFACDATERGVLLLCGQSVREGEGMGGRGEGRGKEGGAGGMEKVPLFDVIPGLNIPPVASGWNSARMEVRKCWCQIELLGPRACCVDVIANVDPKLPLPQSLLNFFTKRIAAAGLLLLQKEARKIARNPLSSPHAVRMRESRFYLDYFVPRILTFCHSQQWILPSSLAPAFDSPLLEDCEATRVWRKERENVQARPPCLPLPHRVRRRSSGESREGEEGREAGDISSSAALLISRVLSSLVNGPDSDRQLEESEEEEEGSNRDTQERGEARDKG